MEGIVEHRHLRRVRHQRIYGTDAAQVARIVDGSEIDQTFNARFNLRRDDAALFEDVTALHDAVPYGVDLVQALQCADLGIQQHLEHKRHALLVGGQIGHDLALLSIVEIHLDEGFIEPNALHASLCQHPLISHVIELILDGAAATVQY